MSDDELIDSLNKLNINSSADSDSTSHSQTEVSSQIPKDFQDLINYLWDKNTNINNNLTNSNNTQNSNKSNLISKNMANTFKPEYLNCVPNFDGNATELNRYLSICESIINNFYDATNPNNFQNTYLLNSLIGKLTGNARLVINIQNVTNWNELKATLNRNFADRRDESCLNRDLVMLKQLPNESPQNFYDKCLEILNLLCSYVDSHENANAAAIKRDLYQKLALKTFLAGLREPLGTTIRSMRPDSLTDAIQFVIQEGNIKYFQNNLPQVKINPKPNMPPRFTNFNQNYNQRPFTHFNAHTNQYQFRPHFPSQPVPIRPNPNFRPPQRFPTNTEVFGKPKNAFKPDPNKPLPRPIPMSVTTRQTYRPNNNNVNNNPNNYSNNNFTNHFARQAQHQPPKFTFEELYNTDANPYYTEYNQNYEYTSEYPNPDLPYEPQYYEGSTSHYDPYEQNECQSEAVNEEQVNFPETPQENTET